MKSFNINHNVKIKLTDMGKAIYKRDGGTRDEDKDGFIELQLHEVMRIFGGYFYSFARIPFKTDMLIYEKDIKDQS